MGRVFEFIGDKLLLLLVGAIITIPAWGVLMLFVVTVGTWQDGVLICGSFWTLGAIIAWTSMRFES